jgi:hypothetical protein
MRAVIVELQHHRYNHHFVMHRSHNQFLSVGYRSFVWVAVSGCSSWRFAFAWAGFLPCCFSVPLQSCGDLVPRAALSCRRNAARNARSSLELQTGSSRRALLSVAMPPRA